MTTKPPKKQALWQNIAESLKNAINQGQFLAGKKLPTEAELALQFGVNRHTVRRALADLAEAALIYTRRGAGAFVTQAPTDYKIGKRVRFEENLRTLGKAASRQVLTLQTRASDAAEAQALGLDLGALVHVYEGLSFEEVQPLARFRSVFPAARFENLLAVLADNPSITRAMATYGVQDYTRLETKITVKLASSALAAQLQLPAGAPLLRTTSVNVDAQGRPVEYGKTWFAGERVFLSVRTDD